MDVRRIGFLDLGSRRVARETGRYAALLQALAALGWHEGRNLAIESRFADDDAERLPALVAELLRADPDLVIAAGSPACEALRGAGVPVVATAVADPVALGLAHSLARPDGDFTGLAEAAVPVAPRHLHLLDAIVPQLAGVAVLANPDNGAHAALRAQIAAAARPLGKQVVDVQARSADEIDAGFAAVARRADALIVLDDSLFAEQMRRIAELSLRRLLASAHPLPTFAEAGGLLGYGRDLRQNFRRAAYFIDRILRGAKAGELAFEQPTRLSLAVNIKAADALGLRIPHALLIGADRVIE